MKKNLLKVCVLSAMTFGSVATSWADVFTVDGINYNLLEDGSGVEVAQGSYTGDIVIPAVVKNGSITYKVVAVGKRAFQDAEVTSVQLPNTVRVIRDMAFNASSLESIDMGTGIEEILDGAFSVCRSLKSVSEIPATCYNFDTNGVFMMNDLLTAINVSPDNPCYKSVDGVVFTKSGRTILAYPNGKGTEYDIPEGVDTIGHNFLNTNQDMTRISFPSTLKVVGRSAFTYCTQMETNNLPDGVYQIYTNAFSNCRKMKTSVPASITYLAMTAFNNCYCVTDATISNKLTMWGSQTFASNNAMTKLTIMPDPETITEIPQFAFQNSPKITEIVVPEGYTKIGASAFSNCKGLKLVDLPSTLTTVEVTAFSNVNPDKIIVRATTPPEYTNERYYLFGVDCLESTPVYVPDESIEAYKAAWIWKFFKNYQPLSTLGVDDIMADDEAEAVTKVYYNLQGVQVAEPESCDGKVYIVKTVYNDGSIKATKVLNR